MPCVMSHISCVQTLVNASGKNRSNVFFFPKLPLSFTSASPEACLDLRLKSGALVPTDKAIGLWVLIFRSHIFRHGKFIGLVSRDVKLRFKVVPAPHRSFQLATPLVSADAQRWQPSRQNGVGAVSGHAAFNT